ncbi:MAG TPA: S41 family peptidase [Actinomycetota bacterium]|nr:S41 family peptidase [Actinomycetota bacterium]
MGRVRILSIALIAVVLAACNVVPPDVAKQIIPERTEYKTLEAAYHVLLERHVDRPSPEQLLNSALDGAESYLKRKPAEATPAPSVQPNLMTAQPSGTPAPLPPQARGAACVDLKIDRPKFTGSTESDLVKASEALDKAAASCKTADRTHLERAAIDGMAKGMNECHTYYLDPDRAKSFNQPPQPYSGIGATILAPSQSGGMSEISSVFPESPAERAGVRPGDRIKSVNGEDVTGFAPEEIAAKIRGPEGTEVRLVLVRGTQDVTFTIRRATLTPPRVVQREFESGKILMLSVSQLNGDVARQTKDRVERGVAAGAKGYILDLRNNPGGDLSAAVDIASIFGRSITLVDQVGRDGRKEQVRTNDRMFVDTKGAPVVVMVNERSASGSEIIAAGLRANGIATVIGVRSAGCVGIAQPRQMPDDGLLLVTLARMTDVKTGEELNGNGRGVRPDVEAKDVADTAEREDETVALNHLRDKIAAAPGGVGRP